MNLRPRGKGIAEDGSCLIFEVMNLQPRGQGMVEDGAMMWEEIGVWKSLNAEKINIKVIYPLFLIRDCTHNFK